MIMLRKVWNAVSSNNFTNCLNKVGIYEKEEERVLNHQDDPFAGLDHVKEDFAQTFRESLVLLLKSILTSL